MYLSLVLAFVLLLGPNSSADPDLKAISGGLIVGESAPAINATDVMGKQVKWDDLLKKGPVVVVFYRGSWCPFCNVYLASLLKELGNIEKYGSIIAITPQKPDNIETTQQKHNITFPLVYDENSTIVKAFRSVSEKNEVKGALKSQYDSGILPVPATYIIGKDGKVIARHYEENYKTRMNIEDLLEILEKAAR